MSKVNPTQTIRQTANWMGQAIRVGEPITIDQARHWKSALNLAADLLEAKDTADQVAKAQTARTQDRIPADYAEQLVTAASKAVKRLANHAIQAATVQELVEIDQDSSNVIGALELLLLGIGRLPSLNDETTGAN